MTHRFLDPYWLTPPPPHRNALRPWLCDRGSLTARLQSRSHHFGVRQIKQGLTRANLDEQNLLRARRQEKSLVREVVLYCDDTPVVFAHSVVSPEHLRRTWRFLVRLGNRPLGAVLFATPQIVRHPLHLQRLNAHHPLYRRAASLLQTPPPRLWARRSMFTLRGSPILVTEVFLPAVLELPR